MAPTKADLAAHAARHAERRRKGEAFLARVAVEKGHPFCVACDTVGARLTCSEHGDAA